MKQHSFVAWRGPSELDGQPVMVVLVPKSGNSKTGKMWQAHILRADMSPVEAIRTGADESICGGCRHRGIPQPDGTHIERSCYVVYAQGPQSTFTRNQSAPVQDIADTFLALREGELRVGAYGDPAAVPLSFWLHILQAVRMWTAYTHQWPDLNVHSWGAFCMASVDTEEEAAHARRMGWRTFRARPQGAPLMDREIECPNTVTGVQCIDCGACDGTRFGQKDGRVSISIEAHGAGAKYLRTFDASAVAAGLRVR